MPRKRGKSTRKGSRTPASGSDASFLLQFQGLSMSGNPAFTASNPEDVRRRRFGALITQTPPRTISNQIFWFKHQSQATVTTSLTAITETNLTFSLTTLPSAQVGAISLLFDQYCIHSVCVSVSNAGGATGATFLGEPVQVITAIDYDSTANLGSIPLLQSYESSLTSTLPAGYNAVRTFQPCVATAMWNTSANVIGGVGRYWIDSAYQTIAHYGFRAIANNTPSAVVALDYTYSLIIGVRNSI